MSLSLERKAFFDAIRKRPFDGITAAQVAGIERILDGWEREGSDDPRDLAYALATAFHETDRTMAPIREYGRGSGKRYGKVDETGKAPYGRGLVQLTWRENYQAADTKLALGGRLAADYDLALDPEIAIRILVRGMIEGWFTGKKLADYRGDYVNARRIINGTDRAKLVAGYAEAFEVAIRAGVKAPDFPPLQRGDKGGAVRTLQRALKLAGFFRASIVDSFGPVTEAAVKSFQKSAGLKADGIVGEKTWAALNKET